jgi:hypothetical protein
MDGVHTGNERHGNAPAREYRKGRESEELRNQLKGRGIMHFKYFYLT